MRHLIIFTLLVFGSGTLKAQDLPLVSSEKVVELVNQKVDSGTVVINFWATWCGPCIGELPYFTKADSLLKGEDYTFIFVSFDPKSNGKKVAAYIKKQGLPGEHMIIIDYDMNTFINLVDEKWEGGIPYTVVITKGARKNHEGAFDSFKDLWHFIRDN